ncbi:MAG: TonB-dependent receptor [Bacteroidaceae bacterium]|nr:TonB-dependent receptor [Bacteroidaceae bacterium]
MLSTQAFADNVLPVKPEPIEGDTITRVADIEEIVVVATPKENARLRQQTLSSSSFSNAEIRARGVTSIKSFSTQVPNLYIPTYGSKLTTSTYIRGIGSRINTPAVGLYVDNIPYLNKNAFDFNFAEIDRVDVLRGPQGTLYGRNTMGGLIRVYTKSPFDYQGTDLQLSAATHNAFKGSITHYHRISDKFAFSGGFYFDHQGGFFKNVAKNNEHVDHGNEYGGRIRAILLPSDNTKLDFNINYEYLKQGAYPYRYMGSTTPTTGDRVTYYDQVAYNRDGDYKRHLLNTGLNVEHQANHFIFNSVTGFQFVKDNMNMDQDYTPEDIFTLNQKQNSKTLSQEFVFKSKPESRWEWTTGLSGFYQWLKTDAPVVFRQDGIKSLIEDHVNDVFIRLRQQNERMPEMSLDVTDSQINISGDFDTPTANFAIYHQSTINDLGVKGLSLTLGARMEYEKIWLDYSSAGPMTFDFNMPMLERMPQMAAVAAQLKGMQINPAFTGKLNDDNWEFLPKAALKYDFNARNNIYFSATKGYRSGGYNFQMFSDLIQSKMSADMTAAINEKSNGMMSQMGGEAFAERTVDYDVEGTVSFKPERSWNFELGTHLTSADGSLLADMAVFLINTTNQQLAQFASSGLGRITVNAGKSRSYGAELSLRWQATQSLSFTGNYGYTYATFRTDAPLTTTSASSGNVSLKGKYVPFVPKHTFMLGGQYVYAMPAGNFVDNIILNTDFRGTGRIYWDVQNKYSQKFYGTLNARLAFQHKGSELALWANNIFNKDYDAFFFESMSKLFRQRGTPVQLGVDLRLRF